MNIYIIIILYTSYCKHVRGRGAVCTGRKTFGVYIVLKVAVVTCRG